MSDPNSAQADYWRSESGYEWIAQETFLDAVLAAILCQLLERTDICPEESLLDIGCGTGSMAASKAYSA